VCEKQFPTKVKYLEVWVRTLPADTIFAIESGTGSKPLYWALKDMGRNVKMAHPLEVRRMMGTKKKTDREDSAFLAKLLRMGSLPESYVPDREQNEDRQFLRYRMDLGKKVTVVKNQIHALLTHNGVSRGGFSDSFGKGGRAMLDGLDLPPLQRYLLDGYMRQLDMLCIQIDEVQCILARMAMENPMAMRLMRMEGVDYYSALVILEEIGDVTRFRTGKHLTSYAGLVPRVHQSGGAARTGRIHKEGPAALRWIMKLCAQGAIKCKDSRFRRMRKRLEKRIGKGKATVAVTRKMLEIIFVLLTRDCEYEEDHDMSTRRKLQKMERRAKELPDTDINETFSGLSETAREALRGDTNIKMTG
jgi:transposase